MKFRVAGGPSGDAGIEVAGRRYEVGDEVELTQKQADWLLEQGYVVSANAKTAPVAPAAKPVTVETPEVIDEGDDA